MINQTCGAVSDAGPLVLVAEDDESAASAVMLMLARDGITCVRAVNGSDALEHFARRRPDVVILDVMMPVLDGFQVCERIRQQDEAVPVLFLTAKGDMVDKRIGYSVGADDYLVKPFSGDELRLRVGALLRRARRVSFACAPNGVDTPRNEELVIGELSVNVHTGVTCVAGEKVELTPNEARIMAVLASHPGDVYSKADLICEIWGPEYLESAIGISVYVRRIREKIEPDPSSPQYLKTVWRCGYRLGERS